jgi:hypothetical protein
VLFWNFWHLQDKRNICTLSVNIKLICTRCETGHKSYSKSQFSTLCEICTYTVTVFTVVLYESGIRKASWQNNTKVYLTLFICIQNHTISRNTFYVKQDIKAIQSLSFLPVSKTLTNKLYIFRQYTYIVYLISCSREIYSIIWYHMTYLRYLFILSIQ